LIQFQNGTENTVLEGVFAGNPQTLHLRISGNPEKIHADIYKKLDIPML